MKTTLAKIGAGAVVAGALVAAPQISMGDSPQPVLPPQYNPVESFAPMVEAVDGAVVAIEVEEDVVRADAQVPRGLEEFFGLDPRQFGPDKRQGEGSGFIISPDGLVLTNAHVVSNSSKLKVKFHDGTFSNARLLGSDPSLDVALLQLPQDREWPYVELGSSKDLRVGDWVLAMGNPLGLGHTVTAGIISGKGRPSQYSAWQSFIQTDAAINPGNSGGPLFNLDGRVIGINTAIIAGANTVGFAVPIDAIEEVLDDLKTDGRVARGFLGITTGAISPELAGQLDIQTDAGAVVTDVHPDTPAAEAGLKVGDVILAVQGEDVTDSVSLTRAVSAHRPDDSIRFTILRKGTQQTLDATLIDREEYLERLQSEVRSPQPYGDAPRRR